MDGDDALDATTGILGTVIAGGIGLMGIKMMTDMVSNISNNNNNMKKNSELKAQNTLNFSNDPKPRREQKSFTPPRVNQKPFYGNQPSFFSPDLPQKKRKEGRKEDPVNNFFDW